jgi:hypothetical protein
LLADAARGPNVWKAIARQMGPQALRMNLNTLLRHEVLDDAEMIDFVAAKRCICLSAGYSGAELATRREVIIVDQCHLHQPPEVRFLQPQ